MTYSKEEIEIKVNVALQKLKVQDKYLLDKNLNERTITHKLAEYLQQEFQDLNVDCEYNRFKDLVKKLKLPKDKINWDDTEAKTVFPDIIIHKRGKQEKNQTIKYYLKNKKSSYMGFNVIMEKKSPPNLSLIRENIEILKAVELRQEDIEELLWEIRKEAYNIINHDPPINQEMLLVTSELVEFLRSYMLDKNEKIQEPIYSSLYLLSINDDTKIYVEKTCHDYFITLYEENRINKDLVNILDNFKHFKNRFDEIIKAIKNKNEIVVNILSFNLENDLIFNKVNSTSEELFAFRKKLLIATQTLNLETDKRITGDIKELMRILKRSL